MLGFGPFKKLVQIIYCIQGGLASFFETLSQKKIPPDFSATPYLGFTPLNS
jgi:hypothetical protein